MMKTIGMVMIGIFITMTLMSVKGSAEQWSYDCQAKCEGSSCNMILGKTEWVRDSDGFCKHITEAKSLLKYYKVLKRDDGTHGLNIIDFNYSCIVLEPYPASFEATYRYIPLKIDGKTKYQVYYPGLLAKRVRVTECFVGGGSAISHNFSFGDKSTTITLQDPGTENLEDTYVQSFNPTDDVGKALTINVLDYADGCFHALLKFNISVLGGVVVESASLYAYLFGNYLDAGTEGFNISSHHVYFYPTFNISELSWTEGVDDGQGDDGQCSGSILCYDEMPVAGEYNSTATDDLYVFGGAGEPTGYQEWDVKESVLIAAAAEDANITLMLFGHDYFGSPASNDVAQFISKDYSDYRPYMNITYSAPPPPPAGEACCTEYTTTNLYVVKANGTCLCSFNSLEVVGE